MPPDVFFKSNTSIIATPAPACQLQSHLQQAQHLPAESCQDALFQAADVALGDPQQLRHLLLGILPPVTQAEAQEKLKDILIRHFGGYTIQDALGGWVGDDKLYQEYTLVVYLSDTTEEAVHAAADEMIETFQQSSVLIQANPTRTEFYAGK